MFIVTLTYLKPNEEIDALLAAHRAWERFPASRTGD